MLKLVVATSRGNRLGTRGWARFEIPKVAEDCEGRIQRREGHDDELQKQQSFSQGHNKPRKQTINKAYCKLYTLQLICSISPHHVYTPILKQRGCIFTLPYSLPQKFTPPSQYYLSKFFGTVVFHSRECCRYKILSNVLQVQEI